ncbi:DEAD/DEAH box helicase [Streptacidiphilus monticola]
MRGGWVAADPARLAAAAAFLAGPDAEGEATAAEILRMVMDGQEPAGLPVSVRDVTGPLRALVEELQGHAQDVATDEPLDPPPGFGGRLRPYQRAGLAWLARLTRLGLGGVLADDMGLGKTVQTLALLALEQSAPEPPAAPTLLVCPMSLVGNWEREAARFAPKLRVHVHHGAGRASGRALRGAAAEADLVITTYGLAQRDFSTLRQIAWHRVVADEAHHIKNTATLQSRAVRSLPARHRLALTGTPVENRLAELHAVLDFANPGLFGDAERFKERWSVPIERNASVRATAELRARTRPFLLRRLKSDPAVAAELPGKQEMTLLCNLTPEQAGLYRAVVNDLMRRVEQTTGRQRHGLVLAALTRLKQICDHPALYAGESGPGVRLEGRSGKLAALEDVLEQALAEGDSALCFTQYASFGSLLQPYLERRLGAPVLFLHGGVPERGRRDLVDRFQRSGSPSVFLLSLKAGGAGLNLTAASQVVHLDRWWNPAVEEQATDRAHRLGQRREVQVRRLVCVGTVEERVADMLEAKRALADAVIGSVGAGGDEWLAELSEEALREALSLAEEAVSEA